MSDLISRDDLLATYDAAHKGPPGEARRLIEEAPTVAIDPGIEIRRMGFDCIIQNPVDDEYMRMQICEQMANALSKSDALVIEAEPYDPLHTYYKARIRVAVPRRQSDRTPVPLSLRHCRWKGPGTDPGQSGSPYSGREGRLRDRPA